MATKHASDERNRQSRRKETARASASTTGEHEHGALSPMRDEVSGYVARGASQIRELTREREGAAVLVALAAGFGVGLVIGSALAGSRQRRPRTWIDRIAAEGLGRRLMERIESLVPEALADRLSR
jgi:hypothetical protein